MKPSTFRCLLSAVFVCCVLLQTHVSLADALGQKRGKCLKHFIEIEKQGRCRQRCGEAEGWVEAKEGNTECQAGEICCVKGLVHDSSSTPPAPTGGFWSTLSSAFNTAMTYPPLSWFGGGDSNQQPDSPSEEGHSQYIAKDYLETQIPRDLHVSKSQPPSSKKHDKESQSQRGKKKVVPLPLKIEKEDKEEGGEGKDLRGGNKVKKDVKKDVIKDEKKQFVVKGKSVKLETKPEQKVLGPRPGKVLDLKQQNKKKDSGKGKEEVWDSDVESSDSDSGSEESDNGEMEFPERPLAPKKGEDGGGWMLQKTPSRVRKPITTDHIIALNGKDVDSISYHIRSNIPIRTDKVDCLAQAVRLFKAGSQGGLGTPRSPSPGAMIGVAHYNGQYYAAASRKEVAKTLKDIGPGGIEVLPFRDVINKLPVDKAGGKQYWACAAAQLTYNAFAMKQVKSIDCLAEMWMGAPPPSDDKSGDGYENEMLIPSCGFCKAHLDDLAEAAIIEAKKI